MSAVFVAERAISPVDGSVAFVVIADDYCVHDEATEYLAWLRSVGRSPNTERAYAGRIARFLTYCAANRLDWQSVSIRDLRRFLRSLVDDPARRPGLRLTTSPPALRLRSNKTANAIFTAVCEFLRFGATRGWVPTALAEDLHYPKFLRYGPPGYDWGENQQFRNVRVRTMRLREYDRPPDLLTVDEIDSVMRAMQNGRDKLLAILLLESGLFSRVQSPCASVIL